MSLELKAFIEYISIIKALTNSTINAYQNDLLQIEESFKKDLIELSLENILHFLEKYENKNTINRKISAINSFFNLQCCKGKSIL